ncbi:MATE family efflux transporter [Dermatophilus congolensis]|uniref:MATE family efflux transporter n=1 Tax=Dermatophilus congolensis TaxID=1863 RepID=UPI00312C76BC
MPPLSDAALKRDIWRLSFPAFLTLVAEPLFLLADSAIIGHLGTTPLAGLAVATTVLSTAVGTFVFLAYATTSVVARNIGAGKINQALHSGVDGIWLALLLGIATGLFLNIFAAPISGAFGASPAATDQSSIYLQISAWGLPSMLVILAVTGLLRGFKDTQTPLVASTVAFTANIILNITFVHGLKMGIAGAACGTVISQTGMAIGLVYASFKTTSGEKISLKPHLGRVLKAALAGTPLLVRTLALRGVLLATTWSAAQLGDTTLAAHQLITSIWTFLMFALDSLAIAGQTLVSQDLGASETRKARHTVSLLTRAALRLGLTFSVLTFIAAPFVPTLFTPDYNIHTAARAGLLVIAALQPIAAYAYLLDGILIGAGDTPWLARTQILLLISYLPLIFLLIAFRNGLQAAGPPVSLAALWVIYSIFMAARAATLHARAHSDTWMITGA